MRSGQCSSQPATTLRIFVIYHYCDYWTIFINDNYCREMLITDALALLQPPLLAWTPTLAPQVQSNPGKWEINTFGFWLFC